MSEYSSKIYKWFSVGSHLFHLPTVDAKRKIRVAYPLQCWFRLNLVLIWKAETKMTSLFYKVALYAMTTLHHVSLYSKYIRIVFPFYSYYSTAYR